MRNGRHLPPDQPVLTSHPVAPCFCIFSASMAAYLVGCSIMKAAPKHAEKVACGSLMPSSVPATCVIFLIIFLDVSTTDHQTDTKDGTRKETREGAHQRGVATDEVVHGLGQAQLAHGGENAKGVAGQENDVLRMRPHAGYLRVGDVLYLIGSPGVLCNDKKKQCIPRTMSQILPNLLEKATHNLSGVRMRTRHGLVPVVDLASVLIEHHILQNWAGGMEPHSQLDKWNQQQKSSMDRSSIALPVPNLMAFQISGSLSLDKSIHLA